jgi:hypothetical protein
LEAIGRGIGFSSFRVLVFSFLREEPQVLDERRSYRRTANETYMHTMHSFAAKAFPKKAAVFGESCKRFCSVPCSLGQRLFFLLSG